MTTFTAPIYGTQSQVWIMEAISSVASDDELADQMVFVSQTEHDTNINLGKVTVAAEDELSEVAQSFTADGPYIRKVTTLVGSTNSPSDYIVCKICKDTGKDTTVNEPDDADIIATSANVSVGTSQAVTATDFTFTESDFTEALIAGLTYWIIFDRTGSASNTNYYLLRYETSASTVATHTLSRSDDGMSTWTADAQGEDMYHVIYAGDSGHRIKDVKFGGGERNVELIKLLGYTELADVKRSTPIEVTFTRILAEHEVAALAHGNPQNVTGDYYRVIMGEKSSNDRTTKAVLIQATNGTYTINWLLNNARVTSTDFSIAADGHGEETITVKALASNTYYEDDID